MQAHARLRKGVKAELPHLAGTDLAASINWLHASSRVLSRSLRVRIIVTPREREIDGVKLHTLMPGNVRDVSSTLGMWLIAQGYARSEMRADARLEAVPDWQDFQSEIRERSNDYGRRSSDRPKKNS
jgi:hypothetical protein